MATINITIYGKETDNQLSFEDIDPKMLINDFKNIIAEKGFDRSNIVLIFRGKILVDKNTLEFYDITYDVTYKFVMMLKGPTIPSQSYYSSPPVVQNSSSIVPSPNVVAPNLAPPETPLPNSVVPNNGENDQYRLYLFRLPTNGHPISAEHGEAAEHLEDMLGEHQEDMPHGDNSEEMPAEIPENIAQMLINLISGQNPQALTTLLDGSARNGQIDEVFCEMGDFPLCNSSSDEIIAKICLSFNNIIETGNIVYSSIFSNIKKILKIIDEEQKGNRDKVVKMFKKFYSSILEYFSTSFNFVKSLHMRIIDVKNRSDLDVVSCIEKIEKQEEKKIKQYNLVVNTFIRNMLTMSIETADKKEEITVLFNDCSNLLKRFNDTEKEQLTEGKKIFTQILENDILNEIDKPIIQSIMEITGAKFNDVIKAYIDTGKKPDATADFIFTHNNPNF